jgi:DUF1680 family protein
MNHPHPPENARCVAPDRMAPIAIRQVHVEGLIGERIQRTIDNNILQLDWDHDFLKPFEDKIGPKDASYIGLGKTLEGLVRLTAYQPTAALQTLRRRVIDRILTRQLDDGYLGMFAPPSRIHGLWDVHEMAYLVKALIVNNELFEERESLSAAIRIADYVIEHLTDEMELNGWTHSVLLVTLGLDRALLALYRVTGEQRFLDFVTHKQQLANWNLPIVEGRHGLIEGHAYAYLCRCMAQLELYNLTGESSLLDQTHKAMDYLTKQGGMAITGTCSQTECWHSDQTLTGELGETCTTAYMIRLYDKLIRLKGDLSYGDFMERSIYNALFTAQSPDGRQVRYYSPLEGKRVYWESDTYCCPVTFRRIISRLPQMIYYRFDEGLAVNLYTPSSIETDLGKFDQITDYPNDDRVTLRFTSNQPKIFTLRLRIPRWCSDERIAVNGEQQTSSTLRRQWHDGDEITLDMPMPWRMVRGFAKQAEHAAVMRGPKVYGIKKNAPLPTTLNPETLDDLSLVSTADPYITATYFPVRTDTSVVDDELL